MINHKIAHKRAANDLIQDKNLIENLPQESKNILKILDNIEEFSLQLKNKLMAELESSKN